MEHACTGGQNRPLRFNLRPLRLSFLHHLEEQSDEGHGPRRPNLQRQFNHCHPDKQLLAGDMDCSRHQHFLADLHHFTARLFRHRQHRVLGFAGYRPRCVVLVLGGLGQQEADLQQR